MLFYILDFNDVVALQDTIQKKQAHVDGFEFRLDCMLSLNLITVLHLRSLCIKPVIFTLRSEEQGGRFNGKFKPAISQYLSLAPDYLDIEPTVSDDLIEIIHKNHSNIALIRSYHNFRSTPEDLERLMRDLYNPIISNYKIVCHAPMLNDVVKKLLWKQSHKNTTVFSMGPFGSFSRVYGKKLVNHFSFTGGSSNKCDGFIPIEQCNAINYRAIGKKTKVFLVIGNPLNNSISDQVYTKLFKYFGIDAVIKKVELQQHSFLEEWSSLMQLDIDGCIVTMPFKNSFCNRPANTIKFSQDQTSFFSTDGKAILSLIREKKEASSILIMGTGGVALSVAREAELLGIKVVLVSRSSKKKTPFKTISYNDMDKDFFDVLVNATPCGMDLFPTAPNSPKTLSSEVLVVDAVYNKKETLFISKAKNSNCDIITGKEVFTRQGALQFSYLIGVDYLKVVEVFSEEVKNILNV